MSVLQGVNTFLKAGLHLRFQQTNKLYLIICGYCPIRFALGFLFFKSGKITYITDKEKLFIQKNCSLF